MDTRNDVPGDTVLEETRRTSRAVRDADSLLELQQKERSRLAFDIHDGPAQSIASALLQLRLVREMGEPDLSAGLDDLEKLLVTALDDLYGAIEQLRSRALDRDSLAAKIEVCTKEFAAQTGISISLAVDDDGSDLTNSAQIALFQIVSEALHNVARHAGARNASVTVRVGGDRVECSIVDDGEGFDTEARVEHASGRNGYGLAGMRERARLLGGECRIESDPGKGCRVEVSIPIWRG